MNEHVGNDRLGVVTAPRTIRIERILPGPIERVWAYLTELDKRKKWLAEGPMANYVGGDVELTFYHSQLSNEPTPADYQKYEGHTNKGKVTRYEPPHSSALRGRNPQANLPKSHSNFGFGIRHIAQGYAHASCQRRLHGERCQWLAHPSRCAHRSPQRRKDAAVLGQFQTAREGIQADHPAIA